MTLDEAIKHAEEVAEEKEHDRDVRKIHLDNRNSHNNIVHYQKACECAEEHRQLANWLKELKQLRKQEKTGHWIDYSEEGFVECPECGIGLQDWHRVERDEDDDISFHEYEFRYCPNCGAKMDEDERKLKYADQDTMMPAT